MKKRSLLLILGASLGCVLGFILSETYLTINQSPSLGYKAFLCFKGLTPKRGDFVSIEGHPTTYFDGLHYTKRLTGLPGERVEDHLGTLKTTTRDGKPLHPLKAMTIPEGYVFVSADHPHSFDSRYEEFGLVKESCMRGTCLGLLPGAVLREELPHKQRKGDEI
jgi:conjugal transfer pilin signal peptidase TrbI